MEDRLRVVVIGAGIVGALIAREFSRYECEVYLVEKEFDAGWGVTKANSAIVHGGFDDDPNTTRARFCAKGNQMFDQLKEELKIDFKRTGSYVLAFSDDQVSHLEKLVLRAKENGVSGCEMHSRDQVLANQKNLNPEIKAGFWCPSAGITEPWMVAMSAAENLQMNGGFFYPAEKVIGIDTVSESGKRKVKAVRTSQRVLPADIVVNAAGMYADQITLMAGLESLSLYPRKGEYILMDKKIGDIVSTVIFPVPTQKSKGILVVPTVDGGILLGPTAQDLDPDLIEDTSTSRPGLEETIASTRQLVPGIDMSMVVKTFAGLRPETPLKDFVIGPTDLIGFFQAAAMRSPGLTSAPAIARYMTTEALEQGMGITLNEKPFFQPQVADFLRTSELTIAQWEELIQKDARYGKMICVCNKVTEGEVVEAIRRGARSVDGVKFRTRAGFGSCQSGFCLPTITELLSVYGKIPMDQVTLRGGHSTLLAGEVRT